MNKMIHDKKPNYPLLAVIDIIHRTGVRPAEVDSMRFDTDNCCILITGAKKTEDNLRGLDREIMLEEKIFERLLLAHEIWLEYKVSKPSHTDQQVMKLLQNQFVTVTKKIWPKRKNRITLKSYRHQMGSNLKASGGNRTTSAAIMGHQSVDSLTRYGNARSATRRPDIRLSSASPAVRKTQMKACAPQISRVGLKNQLTFAQSRRLDKAKKQLFIL